MGSLHAKPAWYNGHYPDNELGETDPTPWKATYFQADGPKSCE